jgi:hypothetical protein
MNNISVRSNSFNNAIMFLVANRSQFFLSFSAAKQISLNVYIYVERVDLSEIQVLDIPDNVKIIVDSETAVALLLNCNCLITLIGHYTPALSKNILRVIKVASSSRLPIVDMPHGLFQWGHNLSDDSKICNIASYRFGAGSVSSFCKLKLSWFGEDGVGYPKLDTNKTVNNDIPKFTLITSNTNWYLMGDSLKREFYFSVWSYAVEKKDELFIWSPHPAELNSKGLVQGLIGKRPSNVLIYGLDKDLYFNGIEGSDELAIICDRAITTYTTCLAEYEYYQKDVVVYSPSEFLVLNGCYDEISTFTNEISDCSFGKLKSRMIKPFSKDKFESEISTIISDEYMGIDQSGYIESL